MLKQERDYSWTGIAHGRSLVFFEQDRHTHAAPI